MSTIDEIESSFSSLPLQEKRMLLKRLVKQDNLANEAMTASYFNGNLNCTRFEMEDVLSAFNFARSRFPSETIYYLSDLYDLELDVPKVQRLDQSAIAATFGDHDDLKVFVCAFESDEQLLAALKEIVKLKNAYYYNPLRYYPTARYFHRNDLARKVLTHERDLDLPKFEVADYENIIQAIDVTRDVPGDYVEIGVYQGRSAHMALHYMRERGINRKSFFLDIFAGFTYDTATTSPDALWINSHTDSSLEAVKELLGEFEGVEVAKMDVIESELPDAVTSIAVCNIDVDMYEAVLAALVKAAPLMSKGGIIIVEDQGHTPALAGGFLALCEFLETEAATAFIPIHMASGQMYLIRK